jgi:hypothetical protein
MTSIGLNYDPKNAGRPGAAMGQPDSPLAAAPAASEADAGDGEPAAG